MAGKSSVTNQTLDRGLQVMALIAEAPTPPTIDELASALGIHRSMAYRLVRTLEDHGLSSRDSRGRCHPGHRLADLARGVEGSLQTAARPELVRLATTLRLTAFVAVPSGEDVMTIDSAEPPRSDSVVAYRPGTRHGMNRGAPGVALLAGRPARDGERPDVALARKRGFAQSTGEVVAGLGSLSTWIVGPNGEAIAAIACLFLGDDPPDPERVVTELRRSARRIGVQLGGRDHVVPDHLVLDH